MSVTLDITSTGDINQVREIEPSAQIEFIGYPGYDVTHRIFLFNADNRLRGIFNLR